jgi:hypothetical protein
MDSERKRAIYFQIQDKNRHKNVINYKYMVIITTCVVIITTFKYSDNHNFLTGRWGSKITLVGLPVQARSASRKDSSFVSREFFPILDLNRNFYFCEPGRISCRWH